MSQDFEDEDAHAAKRYKASRPAVSTASSVAAVDDQSQCRICLERWHNAGPHRVCSLKCGHLFGRSCLERYLDGGNKACPMCRSAAKKTELRDICVSSVVAEDTTQAEALRREVTARTADITRAAAEISRLNVRVRQAELSYTALCLVLQAYPLLDGHFNILQESAQRVFAAFNYESRPSPTEASKLASTSPSATDSQASSSFTLNGAPAIDPRHASLRFDRRYITDCTQLLNQKTDARAALADCARAWDAAKGTRLVQPMFGVPNNNNSSTPAFRAPSLADSAKSNSFENAPEAPVVTNPFKTANVPFRAPSKAVPAPVSVPSPTSTPSIAASVSATIPVVASTTGVASGSNTDSIDVIELFDSQP